MASPRRNIKNLSGLVAKGLLYAAIVGGLALAGRLAWPLVTSAWQRGAGWFSNLQQQKIQDEIKVDKLKEQRRIDEKRAAAEREASVVISHYADLGFTVVSAECEAEEWKGKWYLDAEVAEVFISATNRFATAKRERMDADRRREIQAKVDMAKRESEAICTDYSDLKKPIANINKRADEWREKWEKEKERTKERKGLQPEDLRKLDKAISDATQRISGARLIREVKDEEIERDRQEGISAQKDLEKAKRDATDKAKEVLDAFADESVLPTKAEAHYANWQTVWGRYADREFYQEIVARIEVAKRERSMLESGRAVAAECDRWLANIETASEFNVKNWRDNIKQAELVLKKALNPQAQRISESAAAAVQKKIDERRRWKVGVIDNKTSRTVRLGDGVIGPMTCGTVVFKTGFPVGAAIVSDGCEPVRIREDLFDARVFILMPRMMVERKNGIRATVPPFGKDVVCLVDGVEAKPGEIMLSNGTVHHVLYRKTVQTYAGINDYKDQDIVFKADAGTVVQIPPPYDDWPLSTEFIDAAKNAKLVERGQKVVSRVESLLAPEPVSSRRARLEKVHEILTHWETASALAALGVAVEPGLREKYEAECRRVRGMIRNATSAEASIRTDCATFRIPAGATEMVTFEDRWPGDAYVSVPNYEFVFLPHASSDFDGKEFVVETAKLTPTPVRVILPPLEKDVTCRVDDKPVTPDFRLRPGRYACVYSKPDCVAQKYEITIMVGEDFTLPSPRAWEQSSAMSRFAAAWESLNSGALDAAKAIADEVGTIEDPVKRRELEQLKKAIKLREQMERSQRVQD